MSERDHRLVIAVAVAFATSLAFVAVAGLALWWFIPLILDPSGGRPSSVRDLIARSAFARGFCELGAAVAGDSTPQSTDRAARCLEAGGDALAAAELLRLACVDALANNPSPKLVVPFYRPDPAYPRDARENAIEGWVELRFDVDRQGRVTDTVVSQANPTEVFDSVSLAAVRSWRYCVDAAFTGPAEEPERIRLRFEMSAPAEELQQPMAP